MRGGKWSSSYRAGIAQEFDKQPLGFRRRFGPAVVGLNVVLTVAASAAGACMRSQAGDAFLAGRSAVHGCLKRKGYGLGLMRTHIELESESEHLT